MLVSSNPRDLPVAADHLQHGGENRITPSPGLHWRVAMSRCRQHPPRDWFFEYRRLTAAEDEKRKKSISARMENLGQKLRLVKELVGCANLGDDCLDFRGRHSKTHGSAIELTVSC